MKWLRRRASLLQRASEALRYQTSVIEHQRTEMAQMRLEHARNVRNLIEQFFVAQESGADVREPLLIGLRDMDDEVARLEEHILDA